MSGEQEAGFGARAGGVVVDSFSQGTILSGLALAVVLVAGNWLLALHGPSGSGFGFTQLVLALAFARFAVAGLHGDARGTLFSPEGGSWAEVVPVAGRFLLLTLLWVAPLLVLGLKPVRDLSSLRAAFAGMQSDAPLELMVLYLLGTALAPPVLLIVAVGARGLGKIFSPVVWRGLFGGRGNDLALIYILYLGSLGSVILFSFPFVALLGSRKPQLGLAAGGFVVIFLAGLAVSLLGRLSGFYVLDDDLEALEEEEDEVSAEALDEDSGSDIAHEAEPVPSSEPAPPVGPPLPDAARRLELAWKGFHRDPEVTLAFLLELRRKHAPHAGLSHAICLMLARSGRTDEAVGLARDAIPLLSARNEVASVAEIVCELEPELARLELGAEELVNVGTWLTRGGDLRNAASVLFEALLVDPEEARAVKGLLQIAETKLRSKEADDAAKVYQFLLDVCVDSPLRDDMQRGLADAERDLTRERVEG